MDRVRLNEEAYKCIAKQMSVVGSYPTWEELISSTAKHFTVPVFGGWLAPLRHAFIEAKIAEGDAIYTQILKAFEHLTSTDPRILWPNPDAVENAELQYRHVGDGWFELKLQRCRTRFGSKHVLTAQNCEARVKELAYTSRCLRRTQHLVNRSHLFNRTSLLPESIEEQGGAGKKKRSYKNVLSKPLRQELSYSLCAVAEQLEKEGARVDWISVLNLSERPYNANGPKQYGTSLLSYLDDYGERLRREMKLGANEELPANHIGSACTLDEQESGGMVPHLHTKRKFPYSHIKKTITANINADDKDGGQTICSVRTQSGTEGKTDVEVETRSSVCKANRKTNNDHKEVCLSRKRKRTTYR